jgi:hypothetical protein
MPFLLSSAPSPGTPLSIIDTDLDFIAATAISAGQLVELTAAGLIQPMSSTGTNVNPFGVAMASVAAGVACPVLRKGRICALWSGSATAQYNYLPNISHSSTTPSAAGRLTDAVVNTTVGSEVSAGPVAGLRVVRNPFAGIVIADVNLP